MHTQSFQFNTPCSSYFAHYISILADSTSLSLGNSHAAYHSRIWPWCTWVQFLEGLWRSAPPCANTHLPFLSPPHCSFFPLTTRRLLGLCPLTASSPPPSPWGLPQDTTLPSSLYSGERGSLFSLEIWRKSFFVSSFPLVGPSPFPFFFIKPMIIGFILEPLELFTYFEQVTPKNI